MKTGTTVRCIKTAREGVVLREKRCGQLVGDELPVVLMDGAVTSFSKSEVEVTGAYAPEPKKEKCLMTGFECAYAVMAGGTHPICLRFNKDYHYKVHVLGNPAYVPKAVYPNCFPPPVALIAKRSSM